MEESIKRGIEVFLGQLKEGIEKLDDYVHMAIVEEAPKKFGPFMDNVISPDRVCTSLTKSELNYLEALSIEDKQIAYIDLFLSELKDNFDGIQTYNNIRGIRMLDFEPVVREILFVILRKRGYQVEQFSDYSIKK